MSRDFHAGLLVGVVITILGIIAVGQMAKLFAQTSISMVVMSYHINRAEDYCEFNPGIGVARQFTGTLKSITGVYKNSGCQTSAYLGVIHEPFAIREIRIGTLAAVATGYGNSTLTGIGGVTALLRSG